MKTRSDQTLIHDLRELIAALDRRMPRPERDGERDIAHAAQALRRAALKRIAELGGSPAAAVMATASRGNAWSSSLNTEAENRSTTEMRREPRDA